MAMINMFRGGTPDFKPMFCRGDYPEFSQPFSAPHYEDTPPYDSHAEGALNQGWLTQVFPLVPNMQGNDAHKWQRVALRNVKAVGDIIFLNWVPGRSYWQAQHIEVTRGDELLDGVYIKPVAYRCSWDFASRAWKWEENADYAAAVAAANVSQLPLGKFKDGDTRYAFIDLMPDKGKVPCTFGHNLVKTDDKGIPTEGLDEYYGVVVVGFQVTEGDADKIGLIWKSNIAVYQSAKLSAFECSMQVG